MADSVATPGAGSKSGVLDADYAAAGASVAADAASNADVILKVRRPAEAELAAYKKGALVIAIMIVCLIAHEATAIWDVSYAYQRREVNPHRTARAQFS